MKKAKFSGFVRREIARFEKQLEDGLWDDDMTDEAFIYERTQQRC